MTNPKLTDVIRATKLDITDSIEKAVMQAYEMGVRDGEAKAAGDLQTLLSQRYGLEPAPARSAEVKRAPPPAQSSERRKYGYGVVSGVIRNVIQAERASGVSADEIVLSLRDSFGVIVTKLQLRESLKRMSGAEEIKSVNRRWFPDHRFRADLIVDYDPDNPDSIEALRGRATSASKAGEGDQPSPNENVVDLYNRPR
jgi:hypothetical protein